MPMGGCSKDRRHLWKMSEISIKNLTKQYNNNLVLKGVNFTVKEGEIFAYLGPNGAGKTTTIRILLSIIKPSGGEAKILGENGNSLPHSKIGFVLENEMPFENFTPEEYLKFYSEIYQTQQKEYIIQELLRKFGLLSKKRDKISKFSNGMKRKLCVAKALMGDPEILVLDEPFESIEIEARREIRNILIGFGRKKIVFLSSHNLYEIETFCTSVGIINKGQFLGKWSREVFKDKSLEEFYFKIMEETRC